MRIPVYLFFGYDKMGNHVDDGNMLRPDLNNILSMPGNQALGGVSEACHSISNLQVTDERSPYSSTNFPVCCITFLDRTGDSAADTLVTNTKPRLGLLFYDWSTRNVYRPDQSAIDLGDVDPSAYDMILFPKISNTYTLMLRGSERVHYWLLNLEIYRGRVTAPCVRCEEYDPTVRLTPWRGRNCFLTTWPTDESQLSVAPNERDYSSWTLHKATWSGDATPRLQFEPIGPDAFNIPSFSPNSTGNFMYWPQSRDQDVDRVWTADGAEDAKERPASYQIMACRLRGETFSDPFVVADLSDDTDILTVLNTTRGATIEMLRTEFISTTNADGRPRFVDEAGNPIYNASNIWYTSVLSVLCATAIACEATNPLVNPGDVTTFHVAVRNDGNTYLSGCSLTLCSHNEATDSYEREESAIASITFGPESLQESHWNPRGEDGNLQNVEDDYALCPGKTAVYAVDVVIPSDWSGEKKVLFVAHDGVKTNESALKAQAEEMEPVEESFAVEQGEYRVVQVRTAPDDIQNPNQRHMETLVVEPADASNTLSPAPTSVTKGGTSGANTSADHSTGTTGTSGTAGTSGATGTRSAATPRTGDHSAPGVLAVGLAALGAAALAYERRRSKNERDHEG